MNCLQTLTPLLLCALTCAQTLYVDGGRGDDRNSGTPADPVRSITRALQLADRNTIVNILEGTYGLTTSGELFPLQLGLGMKDHQGLVLRGIGDVRLDLAGSASSAIEIGSGATATRITRITFINSGNGQSASRTIHTIEPVQSLEIDACTFHGGNRSIVLSESTPDLSGCRIHSNLFIRPASGIEVLEQHGANQIFNNTIVGPGTGPSPVGVKVESPATSVVNNLIVGLQYGITTASSVPASAFDRNNLYGCQNPFSGGLTGWPAGNTNLDPGFVAAGNYRLTPDSPLIDLGSTAIPWRTDHDGNPRIIDSNQDGDPRPEVGAFEHPVARLGTTFNASSGALALRLEGSNGIIGAVFFALDEGFHHQPGISPILLDLRTLLPISTPMAALPQATFLMVPPQLPGIGLHMQAICLDPARQRVFPSNIARAIF